MKLAGKRLALHLTASLAGASPYWRYKNRQYGDWRSRDGTPLSVRNNHRQSCLSRNGIKCHFEASIIEFDADFGEAVYLYKKTRINGNA
jgi:hypothetical protein